MKAEGRCTRRQAIARITASAATFAGLGAGCSQTIQQARRLTGPAALAYEPLVGDPAALRMALTAISRAGFGPLPGEVTRVARTGARGWVEQQLMNPDSVPEDPAVAWRVNALDTQQAVENMPDDLLSVDYEQMLAETEQAAILRSRFSARQLRENLADFWINHFNIYALKSDGQALVPVDVEKVIRAHMDSFPQMLMASAHSPAMLNYLDNRFNKKGVANENYARELLELHTLGVDSGYTLRDIKEVARCFTGWTLNVKWQRDQFLYDNSIHDQGRKFIPFLNLTIEPNGGQKDANRVLETLAYHPVTASFLARKLCKHFLGKVPQDIHSAAARAYLRSGGRVSAMLRPVLLDGLFRPDCLEPVIKRPLNYTVSAMRALNTDTDGAHAVQVHLDAMGQPLNQWPMPDGFPEKVSSWASNLLPRWNFAMALATNSIPGTRTELGALFAAAGVHGTDTLAIGRIAELALNRPAADIAENSPELMSALRSHVSDSASGTGDFQVQSECLALAIASPQYQWK
jgi:uncharacterized protein (DUF1800 family)